MNGTENPHAQRRADAAPTEPGTGITLGGFGEDGAYRPTVHPGTTRVSTGVMIDLYAISRMEVDICRRRIGDPERVRLSQLATWRETFLLGALAGENPEYDGNWFDTAAGVWRNSRNSSNRHDHR